MPVPYIIPPSSHLLVILLTCQPLCQFSSVAQSCSTLPPHGLQHGPGFPIHHQLPQLAQTHVHPVGDAIQPSHPLSSPSPPAFSLSQHQSLFQWVSSLHQVATILEFQLLDADLVRDWNKLSLISKHVFY